MLPHIAPLEPDWFRRAAAHQARLTMPAGALGRLLPLGQQLCAVQETLRPQAEPAAVVVMAGDHGIACEGVSAYPQEVTGQMVANFLRGGAAINVLARRVRAQVHVVDMGVKHLPDVLVANAKLLRCPLGPGTRSFERERAMTENQVRQAFTFAADLVNRLAADGVKVIGLGEMGIANSTSASALAAALTGSPVEGVTGRGTGIDDRAWRYKCEVIARGLALHRAELSDPLFALVALGGFEIAGLTGLALHAAARRLVVVLDGFISTVAGLVAARLAPIAQQYFVASHCGVEAGHRVVLNAMDLEPLFELGLRLGEGTGAVLAFPLLQSAADVLRDMATFDGAGVSGRSE